MTRFSGLMAFTSAIAMLGAVPALAQQAAITNIDIEMSRTSTRGPFDVRAEVTNPNDFAVRDIHIHCAVLDQRGNTLKVYDSMILATFPPKQKIVLPRLDVGGWPAQATRASCTSSSAQRV